MRYLRWLGIYESYYIKISYHSREWHAAIIDHVNAQITRLHLLVASQPAQKIAGQLNALASVSPKISCRRSHSFFHAKKANLRKC